MKPKITIEGDKELVRALRRLNTRNLPFRRAMFRACAVVGRAIGDAQEGAGIVRRSGKLRRLIRRRVHPGALGWTGVVSPAVGYSSVQEEGRTILPKKGKYLRFPLAMIGASRVHGELRKKTVTLKSGVKRKRMIKSKAFRRAERSGIGWVAWVQTKEVHIPARPFMEAAASMSATRVSEILGSGYMTAFNRAL